jgi:hypothetical protein
MKKSIPFAKGHAMKYAVIAPSMMYLLYPLNGTVEGYPKEKFVEDLVNEVSGLGDLAITLVKADVRNSARKTSEAPLQLVLRE